jgi:YesN/AraC family two-component response regulator
MNLRVQLKEEAKDLVVLYVEDEVDTRNQIAQILELFFKEVIVASDGLEAFEYFKQKDIDLVMTDLTMPKMGGLDMVTKIRELKYDQHIIILTAHNSSENLMETINLQLDGFLLKPIRMEKMIELLLKITRIINLQMREK